MRGIRIGLVVTTIAIVSIMIPARVSTAVTLSPTYDIPNIKIFVTSDCNYILYMQQYENGQGTDYIQGDPGQRVHLIMGAGQPSLFPGVTTCSNWDDSDGSIHLAPLWKVPVDLDLDGDGEFETKTSQTRTTDDYAFRLPNRSNYLYRIYARWTTPRGETLTGALNVFVDVDCGISINRGAEYTKSRKVTVTINPCPGATSVRVSNDGGFATRTLASPGDSLEWTIPSERTGTITKVVYAKYRGGSGGTVSDDIILDTTIPVIDGVSVASAGVAAFSPISPRKVVVTTRARDTISGLKYVQITNDKSRPGSKRKFAKSLNFTTADTNIFVRVIDRAGNISPWRTATVR